MASLEEHLAFVWQGDAGGSLGKRRCIVERVGGADWSELRLLAKRRHVGKEAMLGRRPVWLFQ